MPYVFQLLAAMIEFDPSGVMLQDFSPIITPILMPPLWESRGNVPALTRLLSDIIIRSPEQIVAASQIEPVLGIFQKLISSKANESHAFDLLEALIESLPSATMQPYFVPVLNIILTRLQNSKTETLSLRFVRLYHLISSLAHKGMGADFFISLIDSIQSGMFVQLYLKVILPETPKLSAPTVRKSAVASLTYTLTSSTAFAETYKKGWGYTATTLLALLELPPIPKTAEPMVEQDVDDLSFGVGFTPLVTVKSTPRDAWSDMTDARKWVGREIGKADQQSGGRIGGYVTERLEPEKQQVLMGYVAMA
jgi:exportin-2 (importin alpha re-exporter)